MRGYASRSQTSCSRSPVMRGPDPAIAELARDADIFMAEATFPSFVHERVRGFLSLARVRGQLPRRQKDS